jgi:hypothetical protein
MHMPEPARAGTILRERSKRSVRLREWCQDATTLRRIHGYATVAWLILAIPAVAWWRHSVPFLVFVSVYANVTGHWSSWQASRVEVKQEEAMDAPTEVRPLGTATAGS